MGENGSVSLPGSPSYAITGASGFIGRALASRVIAAGAGVRGLSRASLAFDSVRGDIRDPAAVRTLVEGASVVVHLAAYVHRTDDDDECRSVNVDGTSVLVDAVAGLAPPAFMVFVSSANVYGDGEGSLDERALCRPTTAYGRSKLEAEHLVLAAIHAGRIRGCVLRPAMVFGPGAPGNLRRLIGMIRSGVVIEIDRGAQRKSILPIATMIDATLAVVEAQERTSGEIFNVSGGAPLTIHEIVDVLAASMHRRPVRISVRHAIARRLLPHRFQRLLSVYSSSSVLDDSKLRSVTGLRPAVTIAEGLAALCAPR